MKFCKKCEKETPTIVINTIEECMVCGAKIVENIKLNTKQIKKQSNAKYGTLDWMLENPDSDIYARSQKVGFVVLIAIIIIGIGFAIVMGWI